MTVHAIRIKAEKAVSLEKAQNVVQNRINKHNKVLSVQSSNLSVVNTDPYSDTGTDYFKGVWRFASSEDKKALLDEIASDLDGAVSWYSVDNQLCDHDEENRSGCPSFTPERTKGSIPEGVN